MALSATIYSFKTELADVDRGVYATLDLRLAQQPSETVEYMLMRFLAYCLEYTEGIAFTEGVAAGDEPAVLVRDLTGRITTWVEVGMPDAQRLHRGSKLADRAAVYTHRNVSRVLAELDGRHVHRAADIPVYAFGAGFVERIAATLERRTAASVTISDRRLLLDMSGHAFDTAIDEHHFQA